MPYGVGDASQGNDYGIEPLDSTSLGLPNLSWLGTQASPKTAYDTYWRQAQQVAASTAYGPSPRPTSMMPGLSSTDFDALQLGPGGPDSVKGGLSVPNLASELDPVRYAAYTPAPPLSPGVQTQPLGKPGQLTLDLIHPFTSFAQATGPYLNPLPNAAPLFGWGAMGQQGSSGIDPMAFLAQRHVDLLSNAPSRALDYLVAPFAVAAKHLLGQGATPATNAEGLVKFAFQKDPAYWQWIGTTSDEFMAQQALAVANDYAPGWQNQDLQAQLVAQFQRDRNVMLGLSSGDEAIDFRAKQHLRLLMTLTPDQSRLDNFAANLAQVPAALLPAIPVIGTQLGRFVDPITPETEAAWEKLTPEARGGLLQHAGLEQTFGTMIATLPVFSGLGAVAAFGARAAAAGTFVGTAYRVYSVGLDVLGTAMKAGVGVALANWTAEIAIPGYTDLLGREIDEAHPISESIVGGAVNLAGYFVAPQDVLGPYLGLITRPARAAIGGGLKAIPVYKIGLGGVEFDAHVARAYSGDSLTAQAFNTDARRLTLSEMHSMIRDDTVAMWEQAIRKGDPEGNFPVDVTTRADRIAYAQRDLMDLPRSLGQRVTSLVAIIEAAKKAPGALATAADRQARDSLGYIRQAIEDRVAFRFVTQYGPDFWSHQLARQGLSYEVDGFKTWLQQQADRMSWTVDMGELGKRLGGDIERWQTLARKMYHREFDYQNGVLAAASTDAEEAGRVMLARQTHLFRADAVELRALIEADPVAARAAAWDRIHSTEELATWWAKEKPALSGVKDAESINLRHLATQLDELAPMLMAKRERPQPGAPREADPLNALHADLEANGQWTLAFKPQYGRVEGDIFAPAGDAGAVEPTFVSYTHVGDGEFLQSPYLEYPMESADLIRIGGEGYVASKLDNLTRSFRTWRIGQFQQASMHRIVTRYEGVTGAQAGKFFDDVQELAAAKLFGPKSIGIHVSPQGAAAVFHEDVQKIGERIFGNQPLRNLDTGAFEVPQWDVIARRAFAQSTKLNLMAGITSRLKSAPNGAGDLALMASDVYVPMLRFGLSPLFRIGEFVESKMLNVMRMGFDDVDPMVRALYVRGGVSRERAMMRQEQTADPMAGALTPPTLTAAPETSAAGFLTRRRSSRPAPEEAAAAEREPAGIDVPGGPEGPARPATASDAGLAEYREAMDDLFTAREADAELAVDPDWMRGAEARFEAARESLLAEFSPGWQAQVAAYEQRMAAFWQRHGQPVQPVNRAVGTIAELRRAEADVAAAETRLVADPDNFEVAAAFFEAADRRAVAAETLRTEGPQPGTELRDMPGQPEAVEAAIDAEIARQPNRLRRALEEVWSPQGMKERASRDLTIKLMRDILPDALEASGSRAVAVLQELKVPRGEWADFLVEDRVRLQQLQDGGNVSEGWAKLFDHADKYRANDPTNAVDALYASPEWDVVSTLWLATEQAARDEAFGVHFFSKYRSAFARSINHPLLGVYPAAWAYKAAKEWFRFLYDNRAFGQGALRLGMTPAVAIAHIEDQQNRLMAITGSTMEDLIGIDGPLSSAFFMFNLVLPGDWSSLPFPFSRSIRLLMRGDFSVSDHVAQNLVGVGKAGGLGVFRDLRLADETANQIAQLFGNVKSPGEVEFGRIGAVLSREGLPPKQKDWRLVGDYPTR